MKDGRSGADDDRSRAIAGDRSIAGGDARTSESCDFAMSTRLFAAGWTMSRSCGVGGGGGWGRERRSIGGKSARGEARRGRRRQRSVGNTKNVCWRVDARCARDRRFATHLHDRRAVVGDRRHALIVVHELIETARALRIARERRQRDDRGGRGKTSKMARDLAEGGGGGGRASVVRMESTTAMHALMFEMSCPFPWDVSVPSRRSTI